MSASENAEGLHLHLQSMRNFNNARERLMVLPGGKCKPDGSTDRANEADAGQVAASA